MAIADEMVMAGINAMKGECWRSRTETMKKKTKKRNRELVMVMML